MYSVERGAMDILFDLMRESRKGLYIVSDTMLSDDAIKYYEKLMKRHKYFGVDYRDEKVKVSDDELLSKPDYRITIIL
jgi:RNase P/RNase MRP subunit p29